MKPSNYSPIGQTWLKQRDDNNLFLHFRAWLPDGTEVGADYFRLVSFSGQEGISNPFEFQLELHADTETDQGLALRFDQMVGSKATAAINLASAEDTGDERFKKAVGGQSVEGLSCFNGIITEFGMAQPGVYQATLKPALWKLSLTNRYRMHKQMNVRDAIATVLKEHGVDYSVVSLNDSSNPAVSRVQDWLQAGESDLDFVHRLMGKAYLFYYFVQSGNSHQLVLANQATYPNVLAHDEPLRYCYTNIEALAQEQETTITQYQYKQTLSSSAVEGVFTRQENAWEQDQVARYQSFDAKDEVQPGTLPFSYYRIYQYGVSHEEVQRHVRDQADRLQTSATSFSGASHCALFHSGHQFKVSAALGTDQEPHVVRPTLEDKSFVLTQVQHQCSLDGGYQNSFQATEASGLITPFSLQDTHQGSILARVVGHDQPQDWRYYEKTNFDPQSSTVSDADAQPVRTQIKGVQVVFSTDAGESDVVWIKLAPHMQTVPEVGVMVWVSRANDESELPEIQSIVQSNGNRVVMPSGWTANTNVGSNYSTSYGDSKGIRFGAFSNADLNSAVNRVEGFYQSGHKQSDFPGSRDCDGDKFKDVSYSQGGGYSYSTSENGADGLLSQSESYGCNYSYSEGAEVWSKSKYGYTRNESEVGDTYNKSLTTGRSDSYSTANGPSYSENTFNGKVDSVTTHNADVTSTTTINTTQTSTSVTNNAISLSATGSQSNSSALGAGNNNSATGVTMNNSITGIQNDNSAVGMQLSNSAVGIQNNNSAVGIQVANSATGVSVNNSTTGVQTSNSALGVQIAQSATGVTMNNSATGYSLSLSATGAAHSISATAETLNISATALSQTINLVGGGLSYQNKSLEVESLAGCSLTLLGAIKVSL